MAVPPCGGGVVSDLTINDRVVVHIDLRDQLGTIIRLAPRGRVVVATDSGDCRTYDRSELRRADR